jgi:hypothetical protein
VAQLILLLFSAGVYNQDSYLSAILCEIALQIHLFDEFDDPRLVIVDIRIYRIDTRRHRHPIARTF